MKYAVAVVDNESSEQEIEIELIEESSDIKAILQHTTIIALFSDLDADVTRNINGVGTIEDLKSRLLDVDVQFACLEIK